MVRRIFGPRAEAFSLAKVAAVVVVFALAVQAQTPWILRFNPSIDPEDQIGQYSRVDAEVCNQASNETEIYWSEIAREAQRSGIFPATHAAILRAVERQNRRSKKRMILMGVEVAGYLFLSLSAAELIQVKEVEIDAGIGMGAGALRIVTTATAKPPANEPKEPASKYVLQVKQCAQFEFFAEVSRSNK